MALVLSCPRCLQARSIASVDPAQPLFCPFCHLELEMPEMPAPVKAETARVRKRKARRWPLVLLALAVLLIPGGLVVAILAIGRHGTEPQQVFVDQSHQRTAYLSALEPAKPILVLSAAAEPQPGVVDRRTTPLRPI